MEYLVMLDNVERYLNGEMTNVEREHFEEARLNNTELDQLVVEQQMFLHQLKNYGDKRQFMHQLHTVHSQLLTDGSIDETPEEEKGTPIVKLWRKYKRTVAVAASIAGITALSISSVTHFFSTKPTESFIQQLGLKINQQNEKINEQNKKLNQLIGNPNKSPDIQLQKSGGTSFLIDGEGYLVTNAHVINGASLLFVVNKGKEYVARNVYNNAENDIAILKIQDKDWKPISTLPYSIRKSSVDLGEEVFTLGFPRNEVVYNKGYMSAQSGYNDDTLSIQVAISANPGNSGGPLLDRNGDVIGILSTRDKQAHEVVFGSKAENIIKVIKQLQKDSAHLSINLPTSSIMRGMERIQQVKKIQDCVFMVKGY